MLDMPPTLSFVWPIGKCIQYRLKNYSWPLAVFRAQLLNGQPLPKVVGHLGQPPVKNIQDHADVYICHSEVAAPSSFLCCGFVMKLSAS